MRAKTVAVPILIACLLRAAVPAAAESVVRQGPVEARLALENTALRGGETVWALVRLRMDADWYVYGPAPGDTGLPTTVRWVLPEGFTAGAIQWPAPQTIETQGLVAHGYRGDLALLAPISVPRDAAAGTTVVLRAEVGWLACRNECIPGKATLTVELPVTAGATSGAAAGAASADPAVADLFRAARARLAGTPDAAPVGILLALVLAFAGGILLNLMPCVFPVLSLKVMALVRRTGADRGEALRHGLLYAAGVLVSLWAIAGLLAALRAGGHLLGWGFQFQEPATAAAAAVAFFLLGLNLFGVYELGIGLGGVGASARSRGGWLGAFAGGLFTTVVATPCSAPFMGTALGYAVAQPPAVSLAVFTALGLGLASPFVLLSAWPGLAARMPKPGRWMETLRSILGFLLMATVVWMAWLLAVHTDAGTVVVLAGALLLSAGGAWVWGWWGRLDHGRGVRIAAAATALVLVAGALGIAVSSAILADRIPSESAFGTAPPAASGDWEAWSPQRLAQARAEGKTVFVDFTAQWCLTCQVNEATSLSDRRVREQFREGGVVLLRADWTDRSDAIASALAELGRAGVPLYALYVKGAAAPVLLPEILTPGIVLDALEKAR